MKRIAIAVLVVSFGATTIALSQTPIESRVLVKLGSDTLSAERTLRTASQVVGDLVRRLPAASQWHYVLDLDARGLPTRFEIALVRASSASALQGLRRVIYRRDGDSVTMETLSDTAVTRRMKSKQAFPGLPESFGWVELTAAWMRRNGLDSTETSIVAPIGGASGRVPSLLKGDSFTGEIFDTPLFVKLDASSRIVSLDGSASTLKYAAAQTPDLDLDLVFASMARHDTLAGAPGTFITGRDTVRAAVGGAALWVDYGRPSRRGRDVFAHGVLGDTLWRTGANAATQFRTDHDLQFGEHTLKAGTYSIWTHLNSKQSELIFNAQTGQWGTEYDPSRDVLRVPLEMTQGANLEVFTIDVVTTVTPGKPTQSGTISLKWADRVMRARFTAPRK